MNIFKRIKRKILKSLSKGLYPYLLEYRNKDEEIAALLNLLINSFIESGDGESFCIKIYDKFIGSPQELHLYESIKEKLITQNDDLYLHTLNNRLTLASIKQFSDFFKEGNKWSVGQMSIMHGSSHTCIGDNFSAGRGFRLEAISQRQNTTYNPHLTIGNNVCIQDYCHIGCINKITIGDNTLIASNVLITDHFHGNITKEDLSLPPDERPLSSKPIQIGKNVWIGDGVCIMPGVTLGDNVIVGANSVVTHSFDEGAVIAGIPAKQIKNIKENEQ